uniref:Fucolectin tachylectin-4 pentraxin-1 domain-containing protein n=1 Tax=Astyanax mexicanus TaxID=7994 RepID=A0A8B9GWX8_ASTMX
MHGHPYKAIGGKTTSEYSQGSCTHTETQDNPWWRLDLQDEYTVTSVTVTNRGDCCSERLNGGEIRIGNLLSNDGNSNPRVGVISSISAGKSQTFTLNQGVSGRYVNVIIPGKKRILTLCEVEVFGYHPSQVKNLAPRGKATQSSLAFDGHPSKAIDKNKDTNYHQGSCTHTVIQQNPWWRVDLLDEFTITSIVITNRGDCCAGRLEGTEIHVGNSLINNGNDNPRVGVISSIPAGKSKSFHFKEGVSGRYLNVIIPGKKRILTLCEVQVFGFPRSEGNAALKGFASQSSNFDDGYAIKAIDGNRDGNYFSGSCTHTKYDLSPWWKLDLQKTHKVSSITITNRQDAVPERLNGAEIRIGDNPAHTGIQNPRCGVISSLGKNPSVTFQCNGMKGRYVTIMIPGRKEYLTLCEVEVFGAPVQ